jgi:hypothetical protein
MRESAIDRHASRVAAGLLFLALAGCTSSPVPSADATPLPLASSERTPGAAEPDAPVTATDRSGVTFSPTAHPTPPAASTLGGSQFVEVIVDELIARSAPAIGIDSEVYPGTIAEGTRLWLYDGPVAAAGYDWYHVVPEHGPLLDPVAGRPFLDAWVAAGSREGEAWLKPVDPKCPGTASLTTLATVSSATRFFCFGAESIHLEGWVDPVWGSGGCGGSEPGWLTCFLSHLLLVSVEPPPAALRDPLGAQGWDAEASRFSLMFAPGLTRPMTSAGQYVEAVGHFDDPAAWGCGMPEFDDPSTIIPSPSMVYACRGTFVVESITVHD